MSNGESRGRKFLSAGACLQQPGISGPVRQTSRASPEWRNAACPLRRHQPRLKTRDDEPTIMKMPKQIIGLALASLAIIGLAASQADGQSAQDGQAVFQKRCAGCHALEADHEGPRLKGVVGRRAGAVKTFTYSKSLHNAGFIWDEAKLDKWLTDTESLVPDNDMSFRVPNPEERAAIIAYLKGGVVR